jgi:hypothetical protein
LLLKDRVDIVNSISVRYRLREFDNMVLHIRPVNDVVWWLTMNNLRTPCQ